MWELVKKIKKKLLNREVILYAVFGVATSVENVLLFRILLWLSVEYRAANLFTLIIVKLTAYICNKNFVFQSHTGSWKELAAEFGRFVVARGATMLLDYFGLILMVELLHLHVFYSKCFLTILVIVINYFTGKRHVFKNMPPKNSTD